MIINFTIQNFGAIRDKQILSFEADKSTHLEDHYIIPTETGHRLLKLCLIYGPNASGKTTVLKAMDFLRTLVLSPQDIKTEELDFEPFLFDAKTPGEPSLLAVEFLQEGVKYLYKVRFTKRAIVEEELHLFKPKKALVFSRTTDMEKQLTAITFGSKIKIEKVFEKTLEANTLWNNTVLGGYLKTNIELLELKAATNWFEQFLQPLVYSDSQLSKTILDGLKKENIKKDLLLNIIQNAGLNIADIKVKAEKNDPFQALFDIKELVSNIRWEDNTKTYKRENEKFSSKNFSIDFIHVVHKKEYSLPYRLESEGTKRYFGMAGLLALLLKNSSLYPIDELEASLHPDLFLHFILLFIVNSKNSQIVATTHNREILGDRDVFRNDVIWFTDKTDNEASELFSLADFDSSVIRDSSNILNVYRTGKLGAKPRIFDYYINIEDGI